MFARTQVKWIGAVCGLCLLAGAVNAQQATENGTQNGANRSQYQNRRERARDDVREGRDRSQRDRDRLQRDQSPSYDALGTTANPETSAADVEHYIAACLLAKNKAEIQISQIALQKSQNEQVKEFARMLIDDHTKAVEKLQPLGGMTKQYQSNALTQLASLEQAIGDECTSRVREKLQESPQAEFDQCFLGAQLGAHMQLSAALGVFGTQATGQVQELAQSLKPTVDKHLQKAEELMKQTKPASEQASRTSGRTAR